MTAALAEAGHAGLLLEVGGPADLVPTPPARRSALRDLSARRGGTRARRLGRGTPVGNGDRGGRDPPARRRGTALGGRGRHWGCLTASIAAADAARPARMWLEEAIHLQRVIALWPRVDTSPWGSTRRHSRKDRAGVRPGRPVGRAVAAGERALALATAAGDARRVSRLTTLCGYVGFWLGRVRRSPWRQRRWIVALTDECPTAASMRRRWPG